jgi:AAA+ ATPase superfamily predicted ATPase
MQQLWDLNKGKSKLNLILIGSVYSLMHKIFQNSKEPLFGRADRILFIKPFTIKSLNAILADYGDAEVKVLFDVYVFTGGMPKYLDILATNSALRHERILDFMFEANSPFLNEGRTLLIEEFGKEYATYFSILELIATGKTARTEIESILERNVGGHLERLENDYFIISRHKPIDAKPNSRLQKYAIADNFVNFWFRFIYRNRSAVETGNFSYIKALVKRDYSNFCGKLLEKFFRELFADSGHYNRIGSYWEKDNQNEIDLVAVNDMEKKIVMAEVKLNKAKINVETLKQKSQRLLASYSSYRPAWLGLSLEDAKHYL